MFQNCVSRNIPITLLTLSMGFGIGGCGKKEYEQAPPAEVLLEYPQASSLKYLEIEGTPRHLLSCTSTELITVPGGGGNGGGLQYRGNCMRHVYSLGKIAVVSAESIPAEVTAIRGQWVTGGNYAGWPNQPSHVLKLESYLAGGVWTDPKPF